MTIIVRVTWAESETSLFEKFTSNPEIMASFADKINQLMTAGKTDGVRTAVNDYINTRTFSDQDSANEFISFVKSAASMYGLQLSDASSSVA